MQQTGRPGRPRSTRADEAILVAARELLAEGGLSNLTVEGTASRAGVAKTTVYRRYPSKLDLAVAAIAALIETNPEADTLEDATTTGVSLFVQTMGASGAQAAYLAVAAAAAHDPAVQKRFAATVVDPVHRNLDASFRQAVERGEADSEADLEFIHDVLMGTLLQRLVIRKEPIDDAFRHAFTDLVRFVYHDPR